MPENHITGPELIAKRRHYNDLLAAAKDQPDLFAYIEREWSAIYDTLTPEQKQQLEALREMDRILIERGESARTFPNVVS